MEQHLHGAETPMANFGCGNNVNYNSAVQVQTGVTEISSAGYSTMLKKVDGSVVYAGLNTNGQAGIGTNLNQTSFVEMQLPTGVGAKVKYIKAR